MEDKYFTSGRRRSPGFSVSPRLKELEKKFKSDGGTYREYTVGGKDGLFDIATTKKKFNANAVKFGGKHPYVVRTSQNNGIRGMIDEDESYLNLAKTISFGQDTATIFYQDKPYFTGDKIKVMTFLKGELNSLRACYLLPIMRKAFSNFQWGQSSFNEKILADIRVSVPTEASGEIAFSFMEYIISELEKERVLQLDAYLKSTGLNDYQLTDEDRSVLAEKKIYKNYTVMDLFDIHPTKAYKLTNVNLFSESGEYSVVTNTSENYGRSGKTTYVPTEKDIITFSDTGTKSPDSFFYQEGEFVGYPHVQGMYPYDSSWNKWSSQYLITILKMKTHGIYDYSTKMSRVIISNLTVSLPVNLKGDIDYAFMERYIKVIEKIVISKLVIWKDENISKIK